MIPSQTPIPERSSFEGVVLYAPKSPRTIASFIRGLFEFVSPGNAESVYEDVMETAAAFCDEPEEILFAPLDENGNLSMSDYRLAPFVIHEYQVMFWRIDPDPQIAAEQYQEVVRRINSEDSPFWWEGEAC